MQSGHTGQGIIGGQGSTLEQTETGQGSESIQSVIGEGGSCYFFSLKGVAPAPVNIVAKLEF